MDLPIHTRKEVSMHDDISSAWIILHDLVYDISEMFNDDVHPGGQEILLEYLGSDATSAFESCGHSKHARRLVQKYLIGRLPEGESTDSSSEYIAYSKLVPSISPLVV